MLAKNTQPEVINAASTEAALCPWEASPIVLFALAQVSAHLNVKLRPLYLAAFILQAAHKFSKTSSSLQPNRTRATTYESASTVKCHRDRALSQLLLLSCQVCTQCLPIQPTGERDRQFFWCHKPAQSILCCRCILPTLDGL